MAISDRFHVWLSVAPLKPVCCNWSSSWRKALGRCPTAAVALPFWTVTIIGMNLAAICFTLRAMRTIFLIVMLSLGLMTMLIGFVSAWQDSPSGTIFAICVAVAVCAGLRWYLRRRWMRGLIPPRQ